MQFSSPPVMFVSFCFLVALRDVLSQRLLGGGVHPTFMLLVYSVEMVALSWVVLALRGGDRSVLRAFRQLTADQRRDVVRLNIATFVVYVVTIWGIHALTSPVFNLIDYTATPLLTVLAALAIPSAGAASSRVAMKDVVAAVLTSLGIAMLWWMGGGVGSDGISTIARDTTTRIWLLVALLSPVFTAVSSAYQKRQVDDGMAREKILLFRFPLSAAFMGLWFVLLLASPEFAATQGPAGVPLVPRAELVPILLIIGAATVFLPLWLLCSGFVRASLGQFSAYLFMITLFTFLMEPLAVPGTRLKLFTWPYPVPVALMILGYLVAEGVIRFAGPAAPPAPTAGAA